MAETTYYRLDDGDAIVRVVDGYDKQVWRPSLNQWVDIEIDLATEGREIPAAEAEKAVHSDQFGEFAPQ